MLRMIRKSIQPIDLPLLLKSDKDVARGSYLILALCESLSPSSFKNLLRSLAYGCRCKWQFYADTYGTINSVLYEHKKSEHCRSEVHNVPGGGSLALTGRTHFEFFSVVIDVNPCYQHRASATLLFVEPISQCNTSRSTLRNSSRSRTSLSIIGASFRISQEKTTLSQRTCSFRRALFLKRSTHD